MTALAYMHGGVWSLLPVSRLLLIKSVPTFSDRALITSLSLIS